jgi:2-oxoglutarate dehydrogenase E1 component
MNGIVLLLPHGYDGQGSEHSSARLERWLDLCATNNLQITNCTTPANYFHLLRRQLHRNIRKPLIVFTPKNLLRHPLCISTLNDFTSGGFNEVIDDHEDFKNADRLILCSGKVYYDLIEYRKAKDIKHTAIIRLEQLYPFPQKQLDKILNEYQTHTKKIWLQEEPENMGAWSYIFRKLSSISIKLISRPESASPATGSHKHHEKQQQELIAKAFE